MSDLYKSRLAGFEDGAQHVSTFASNPAAASLVNSLRRVLIWKRILTQIYSEAPQSVLLQAGHAKIVEFWILVPLGLDHGAYACLRTMYDSFQSFGYYLNHRIEWEAVCRSGVDWMLRSQLIEYYREYIPNFREFDQQFGYRKISATTYRRLSYFIHNIPAAGLPRAIPLDGRPVSTSKFDALLETAETVDQELNLLFIALFHPHMVAIGSSDYRQLIRGVSRSNLDSAGIHIHR